MEIFVGVDGRGMETLTREAPIFHLLVCGWLAFIFRSKLDALKILILALGAQTIVFEEMKLVL
jgi:hypothetical protein